MNNNKVLVLGIDGMDPKMTKCLLDEGKLPNIKKMLSVGAAREDLVMLGGNPTITPPMWTTLSTGAYPMTHGVTCYWGTEQEDLGTFVTNFDSKRVHAEQIWESVAKAGKKALVWTWPCSWPAALDSPNLHVVGGTAPNGPNAAACMVEDEHITYASVEYTNIQDRLKVELHGGAGCIVTEDMLDSTEATTEGSKVQVGISDLEDYNNAKKLPAYPIFCNEEGEESGETDKILNTYNSPIREPKNWAYEVPQDAKEFYVVISKGMSRYPALMLKNEAGIYDRVAVYTNKKDAEPFITVVDGEFHPLVETTVTKKGEKYRTTRHFSILKIDPEGKHVSISAGIALDIQTEKKESTWNPKSLYQQTIDIAGHVPCAVIVGGGYEEMISRRTLPSWNYFQKWQAKALMGLIEANDYDAVFTHNHSCDHLGHPCWRWAKTREKYGNNDEKVYQGFLEEIYFQVDEYVGTFLPLLDKGWAIIVTSDHGLLCGEEDELPLLGEGFCMNVGVMIDLGYTVMVKDEDGNNTREIDWSKTTAVAPRGNHIYLNLKGRNPNGIVDPADKYELERKIIDDLYNYRFEDKRVVNIAMRNKDAALIGMSGEHSGDIIYFLEEGFNRLHGDSLSTTEGYFGTSVSPIFFAAGAGIKKGIKTSRMIREVDVAPTVATIMGIRIPAQCEGAPVYQILESGTYTV